MSLTRLLARFALAMVAALVCASAAFAHATLVRSDPPDRAVIANAPQQVTLLFNEPVSPLALRLLGASGHALELTDITAANASLTVRLPQALPQGTHVLSWRVISADGHPIGGAVSFSVGKPDASVEAATDPDVTALRSAQWLVRIAFYVGLFFGVGGAFYAAAIARARLPAAAERAVSISLQAGLVAALISVGLQGLDVRALPFAALPQTQTWIAGLATSYGMTAGIGVLAFAAALASLRAGAARPLGWVALLLCGAALAASGHASSAGPQWLTRPAVFLHAICVAFWIGALMPLAASLRAADRTQELARFSRIVPYAVGVLLASGVLLAGLQVQRLDALWTTAYGLVLVIKLGLVLSLSCVAGFNRALTPRVLGGDGNAARLMRQAIAVEAAIAIAILGLVGLWRFTPPPRALALTTLAPIHAHIHSDRVMADLTIEPDRNGRRTINVTLLNGEFGPLDAKEVTLFLSRPEDAIEPVRLPARYVEATIWRVEDAAIPRGRWRLRVEVLITDFEKATVEDTVELPR